MLNGILLFWKWCPFCILSYIQPFLIYILFFKLHLLISNKNAFCCLIKFCEEYFLSIVKCLRRQTHRHRKLRPQWKIFIGPGMLDKIRSFKHCNLFSYFRKHISLFFKTLWRRGESSLLNNRLWTKNIAFTFLILFWNASILPV